MKTVFIFPGQGSQSQGMLSDFYQNFDIVKQTFTEASEVLSFDLWNIIQNNQTKLNQTLYTQNAMLVSGIACYRVLQQETSIAAEIMAGHSLGEITALVAGGSINFTDSIKITKKRAELMQNAVPSGIGSMAAILGLDDEKIIDICNNYQGSGIVEAVNFNANGQVVIAGNTEAVEKACSLMKESGAKRTIILPVSVPSHSSLMTEAAIEFLAFLNDFEFKMPNIKVLHNVNAKVAGNTQEIKENLGKQLHNPVLWTTIIKNIGSCRAVEVGPGKVLSGLNRRIDKSIISKMVFDLPTLKTLED